MRLAGLVPFSLQDFPGRAAAVVFAIGCRLRCPYCHNPSLAGGRTHRHRISEESFLEFLELRRGKLSGVVMTGGEATDQEDLPQFLRRIRELGFATKLDTNGTNPERLERILDDGLVDYVAMDFKDLPEAYPEWLGPADPEAIEASLRLLQVSGVTYELRTTVVAPRLNLDRLEAMSERVGGGRWFLQPGREVCGAALGGGWSPPDLGKLRSWAGILRDRGSNVALRAVAEAGRQAA